MKTYHRLYDLAQKVARSPEDEAARKDLAAFFEEDYWKHSPDGEDAAKMLSDVCNHMAGEKDMKLFLQTYRSQHPTLQQSMVRWMMALIHETAQKEYFDGRDEASVKLCREIERLLEEHGVRDHLPLI